MNDEDFYQNRARKRLVGVILVLIAIAGAGWYFTRSSSFQKISALEDSAAHFAAQAVSENFSAPPPLIATSTDSGPSLRSGSNPSVAPKSATANKYVLTRTGVIADTNAERQAVPLLAEDLARNTMTLLVDGEW